MEEGPGAPVRRRWQTGSALGPSRQPLEGRAHEALALGRPLRGPSIEHFERFPQVRRVREGRQVKRRNRGRSPIKDSPAELGVGWLAIAHESDVVAPELDLTAAVEIGRRFQELGEPSAGELDEAITQLMGGDKTGKHEFGAIYDLAATTKNTGKPIGEWNSMEIRCGASARKQLNSILVTVRTTPSSSS